MADYLNGLELSILQKGVDDWISIATVNAIAHYYADNQEHIEVQIERALYRLLEMAALEIGDLSDGFQRSPEPWESALRAAMDQYRTKADFWGLSVWFDNTELGDRMANSESPTAYLADGIHRHD